MIIDSHAHYNHHAYDKPFRYLAYGPDGYSLREGNRESLLQALREAGIRCSVEPGISLASCEEILGLCKAHPDRLFPAMGVHPTRAIFEKWADRKKLRTYVKTSGVVAVGETGLDYHFQRKEQHRLKQYIWFLYQLDLAWKQKLPVILHVRDAHADVLRILRHHPARKLGGVVHCYTAGPEIAQQYLNLGYHIGIGGSLLQPEQRAGHLWEAVGQMPLDRILVETDAPYILPYCKDVIAPKQLRRARNTSLILPAVIEKIAALKGLAYETVERAAAENAVRLFRLPVTEENECKEKT